MLPISSTTSRSPFGLSVLNHARPDRCADSLRKFKRILSLLERCVSRTTKVPWVTIVPINGHPSLLPSPGYGYQCILDRGADISLISIAPLFRALCPGDGAKG